MSANEEGAGRTSRSGAPAVTLVPVDDAVLEELVVAAIERADADEVTPPVGPPTDDPATGWSPERVAWLRAFHRDRRAGLDGPAREATWAVLLDARVAGSVRLASTAAPASGPGAVETGVWLVREVRGRGAGHAVMTAVLERAAASGAATVVARTTTGNLGALAVLRRAGFALTAGADGSVEAVRGV